MKFYNYIALFVLLFSSEVFSQTPTDYLSAEFHKERRATLRSKMPANSVAIIFANPIRNRANDVDYVFHQDPNFYYLTGYREPNAVLVVYKNNQTDVSGNLYNEVLYVQKKNKLRELWDGKRLGVKGAKEQLGFSVAKNAEEFAKDNISFKKFSKVFTFDFKDDYRNSLRNNADVFDLVSSFKKQSGFNDIIKRNPTVESVYKMMANVPDTRLEEMAKRISEGVGNYPELKEDKLLNQFMSADNDVLRKELKQKIIIEVKTELDTNIDTKFLTTSLAEMREVKTAEELKVLTKAIRISAVGQIEMMKAMKPHMSETEIQGIHEFVYKKYGAEYEGYPSIVGAGNNGCILHYIENNKTKVGNDLVLMDLGAEYRGYTADVTRTIPANGKFSEAQKAIYNIVLKAQDAGIAVSKIDNQFWQPGEEAKKVINKGLFELGIIKSVDEKHNYFPHGTSHHIGLDVHDPGTYGAFKENMVITVEPGIYIPEEGFGIRLEDDVVIQEKGDPFNLMRNIPIEVDEIEEIMNS